MCNVANNCQREAAIALKNLGVPTKTLTVVMNDVRHTVGVEL
jgi:hypothetical protein